MQPATPLSLEQRASSRSQTVPRMAVAADLPISRRIAGDLADCVIGTGEALLTLAAAAPTGIRAYREMAAAPSPPLFQAVPRDEDGTHQLASTNITARDFGRGLGGIAVLNTAPFAPILFDTFNIDPKYAAALLVTHFASAVYEGVRRYL